MNGTIKDKYIHFRKISNNIPDLLTRHGILTLHNELVKILKLPQQGLDQKPTQSPERKKYGIIFLVYYILMHLLLNEQLLPSMGSFARMVFYKTETRGFLGHLSEDESCPRCSH